MKEVIWLAALAVAALIGMTWLKAQRKKGNAEKAKARAVLTEREQAMFFRLVEAFPNEVVLAQVAFSALITAKSRVTRNIFDRKITDFVICTKGFKVLVVIELDDSSHKDREKKDAARSELLTNAGYEVLRFKNVPDVETLRKAIKK